MRISRVPLASKAGYTAIVITALSVGAVNSALNYARALTPRPSMWFNLSVGSQLTTLNWKHISKFFVWLTNCFSTAPRLRWDFHVGRGSFNGSQSWSAWCPGGILLSSLLYIYIYIYIHFEIHRNNSKYGNMNAAYIAFRIISGVWWLPSWGAWCHASWFCCCWVSSQCAALSHPYSDTWSKAVKIEDAEVLWLCEYHFRPSEPIPWCPQLFFHGLP